MSEITGVGFYESLNKFFVGFLILVLFVGLNSDLFINPLFLISAYIVGCIYQAIIQVGTASWLSLREDDIRRAYDEVYGKKENSYREYFCLFIKKLFHPMCLLVRSFGCNKSNNKKKGSNSSKKRNDYLLAYYKVAKAGLLMNIPVLEALENFMRNLILIIPFYFICFVLKYLVSLWGGVIPILKNCQSLSSSKIIELIVFLVLAFVGVVWLQYYYQQTIYRLVWEGNKYLDKINSETK